MTPKYFVNKIKVNFPEIHGIMKPRAGVTLDLQSMVGVVLGDITHAEFITTIDADDAYEAYTDLESFNRTREIELDFFYKYIQDNIDLIHFRLL